MPLHCLIILTGASRGYVSRHFLPDSVEKVTLCDTSQTHLDKALVGEGVKVEKVVMDEENIDVSILEKKTQPIHLIQSHYLSSNAVKNKILYMYVYVCVKFIITVKSLRVHTYSTTAWVFEA